MYVHGIQLLLPLFRLKVVSKVKNVTTYCLMKFCEEADDVPLRPADLLINVMLSLVNSG